MEQLSKSEEYELVLIGRGMPVFAGNLSSTQEARRLIDKGLVMMDSGAYLLTEAGFDVFVSIIHERGAQFVQKVKELAEEARSQGLDNAAIVLHSLSGAMLSSELGSDFELAKLCQSFCKMNIQRIKEAQQSRLN